jgi:hypothetical protein
MTLGRATPDCLHSVVKLSRHLAGESGQATVIV